MNNAFHVIFARMIALPFLQCITISGDNAWQFLQGQLTCDLRLLEETPAIPGAHCDHKGRVQYNFWLWRHTDQFFMLLPLSLRATACKILGKYALLSKVTVQTVDRQVFGQLATDTTLEPSANTTVVSLPDGRAFIVSDQSLEATKDPTPWQLANIAMGLCFIEPATRGLLTPQMIQLDTLGGVSFNKGCYLGQEIIARSHFLGRQKRHLYRSEISAEVMPGSAIHDNAGQEVGVVVATATTAPMQFLAVVEDRAVQQPLFVASTPLSFLQSIAASAAE